MHVHTMYMYSSSNERISPDFLHKCCTNCRHVRQKYTHVHRTKTRPTQQIDKNEHTLHVITPGLSGFCTICITCVQHDRDCERPCELQEGTDMLAINNNHNLRIGGDPSSF